MKVFIKLSQVALDVLDFITVPPGEFKESFALIGKTYVLGKEVSGIIVFYIELRN